MIIFDIIYDECGAEHGDALDYASGLDWGEIETYEHDRYIHSNYVDCVQGVEIWYCYGADHYWFSEEEA
jgi:hypothetical protein